MAKIHNQTSWSSIKDHPFSDRKSGLLFTLGLPDIFAVFESMPLKDDDFVDSIPVVIHPNNIDGTQVWVVLERIRNLLWL